MELSKIAAIAGQSGLYIISSPLKNGVLMESLDEKKTKSVANATSKVSILSEISIYTITSEGSVPLEQVLKALYAKYGKTLPATAKSDGADLKSLLKSVLEEVDFDRVYVSDIKKLATWYQILAEYAIELLKTVEPEVAEAPVAEAGEESPNPKAKKAPARKANPKEKK
jgi:Domain of unknown function (DUF5606)